MIHVVAFGVFDILHPGHIYYLTEAKKLGDKLTVIIARDSSTKALKNKTPIKSEEERKLIIESLRCVDQALIGNELSSQEEREKILEDLKPDIIALGYDQKYSSKKYKTVQIPQKEDHSSTNYLKRA